MTSREIAQADEQGRNQGRLALVEAGLGRETQVGQSGRNRDWVTAERTSLVAAAERGEMRHDVATAAIGRNR